MNKIFVVLLILALTGCGETEGDRIMTSNFRPNPDNTWEMMTQGQPADKDGNAEQEQERMKWISDYLRINHLCPNGYVITDRTQVITDKGLFGDFVDIDYKGQCKT